MERACIFLYDTIPCWTGLIGLWRTGYYRVAGRLHCLHYSPNQPGEQAHNTASRCRVALWGIWYALGSHAWLRHARLPQVGFGSIMDDEGARPVSVW